MKDLRKIVRQTLQEYITPGELKNVEKFADNLFSDIGVDVEFTRHFLDRVNDLRNKTDITPEELKDLYLKTYKKYKELIPMIKPGEEKVISDPETNLNVPFVMGWDGRSPELDMVNKTIMRKKDFKSYTPKLTLEEEVNENLFETSVKSNERINIYRDNNYIVVRPLSERASCKYGAFTKWCISAPGAGAWGSNPDAVIIMILQRNYKITPERQELIYKFLNFKEAQDNGELTPELEAEMESLLDTHDYHDFENLSKIALVFTPNSHMVEIWDANNIQINDNYQFGWQNLPIDNNVIDAIENYISTYRSKKSVDSEMDVAENIDVPINVGDTVLGGKFKNKKVIVKTIDKNEKGDITINNKPLLRFRTVQEEFRPSKDFYESIIKVSDLYVEADNMLDAYNKSNNIIGHSSYSTGKPIVVSKLMDGSLILLNGHHRIADAIKYMAHPTVKNIFNLKFEAVIHDEKYDTIEDMPSDFQYWMPFMDWASATFTKRKVAESVSSDKKLTCLYIHGLGAEVSNDVKESLAAYDVIYPQINYNGTSEPYYECLDIANNNKVDFIIGHSVGGVMAFYLAKEKNIPALLLCPAFGDKYKVFVSKQIKRETPPMMAIIGSKDQEVNKHEVLEKLDKQPNCFVKELPIGHDISPKNLTVLSKIFVKKIKKTL